MGDPRAAATDQPATGRRWKDHRTIISGVLFRERTGTTWRDLPERFGNWKTVYQRKRRWAIDGSWDRIAEALRLDADTDEGRDWTVGQRHDSRGFGEVVMERIRIPRRVGRPRTRPGRILADKAYSSKAIRAWSRLHHVKTTIPERDDQVANRRRKGRNGGRPPAFDQERYRRRNTVERAINKIKGPSAPSPPDTTSATTCTKPPSISPPSKSGCVTSANESQRS